MTAMYQMQQQAFASHAAYAPSTTDSTSETPPTFVRADMAGAMQQKAAILSALPETCAHCNAPMIAVGGFVEDAKGNVWQYCRQPGACGKSRILFKMCDRRVPVYEQVCVFVAPDNMYEHYGTPMGAQMIPAVFANAPGLVAPSTLEQLHGIVPPAAPCKTCNQLYSSHRGDVDTNGWRIKEYAMEPLPAGWPKLTLVGGVD